MDNANKRAKALRAAGSTVDEPALASLKVEHKVWLSHNKKGSKAVETDKVEEKVEADADAEAAAEAAKAEAAAKADEDKRLSRA